MRLAGERKFGSFAISLVGPGLSLLSRVLPNVRDLLKTRKAFCCSGCF